MRLRVGRNRVFQPVWPLVWVLAVWPAWSAEVDSLEVDYDRGLLRIALEARVAAPYERVAQILVDYDNIHYLIPLMVESRQVPPPRPDVVRVAALLQGCLWFFCAELDHVMDIAHGERGYTLGRTVPAQSDFGEGYVRWRLVREAEAARLFVDGRLQPELWVPPLIGPYLIEAKLKRLIGSALDDLESRAASRSGNGTAKTRGRRVGGVRHDQSPRKRGVSLIRVTAA